MECQNLKYLPKQDIMVPCGHCAFCSATRRSDWATRLHYEAKLHYGSKFITLTYANPHLTWKDNVPQLNKSDLQNWFKKVRKAGFKLRYYAVGEYGSKTFRPHYHVILFGDVPDVVLRKAWSFGEIHIGTVTQASIAYCLGYIVNGKGWKMKHKRVAPFCTMSRRPGLGVNYLSKPMVDWHKSGLKNYVLIDGVKRHLPRYYKLKMFNRRELKRIAFYGEREKFLRDVKWLRSPAMRRQKDPLKYRSLQLKRLAQAIKLKCKENLTI